MKRIDISNELARHRIKSAEASEKILSDAKRILHAEAFRGKNILNNLKHYSKLSEVLNEDDVDGLNVFSMEQIKEIALTYRLRFIDSQCYKYDFPYECILKLDHLNLTHQKNIKGMKLLGTDKFFKTKGNEDIAVLFAPTDQGNYYLVHQWGKPLHPLRKLSSWPFRNIENLFISLMIFTLIVTLCLPTYLITLDRKATYWCGYRAGVFFHLLIFFMGFTTYFTFAFSRNLGTMMWNRERDF